MKLTANNVLIAFIIGLLLISNMGLVFAGTGSAPDPLTIDTDHTHAQKKSVTIGHKMVGGNISVVMGLDGFAGGNVAVSSGLDGLLIVYDILQGFEHKLENILSALKKCEDCGNLKYLINTHGHFDHTGTNEYFGSNTVLIAHEAVPSLLAAEQELKAFNMVIPATRPVGLPDITFTNKSYIYFNGEEIELTHYPNSHTSGDIIVYFKQSGVLHLGDLFFNGMFPFIDLEHGGNIKGMISSTEKILEHYPADTKIIPGHGAVANMIDLRLYLQMLKETSREVEKSKKAGMSLESIQNQGLDKRWSSWSWKFVSTETWIALIYNSL